MVNKLVAEMVAAMVPLLEYATAAMKGARMASEKGRAWALTMEPQSVDATVDEKVDRSETDLAVLKESPSEEISAV
jgi:hypothetical protein